MPKYINAEKIELKYEFGIVSDEGIVCVPMRDVKKSIENTPAADVVEVNDCEKCKHFEKHATQYPCSHCKNCYTDKFDPKYKKPTTNFDRIKAMNVEELASVLMCHEEYDLNFNRTESCKANNRECNECTRKWLESEVEVE